MNPYRFLFILLSSLSITSLPAQVDFGIKGGLNFSTTYGPIETFNGQDLESQDSRLGFQIGAQLGVDLNDQFSLLGELNFEQRNYVITFNVGQSIPTQLGDVLVAVESDFENQFSYLSLPLLLAYGGQKVRVYAGPSVAFLLSAKADNTINTAVTLPDGLPAATPGIPQSGIMETEVDFINDAPYDEDGSFINRVDLAANLGLMYQFSDRLAADFRIIHSILDTTNNDYDVSIIDQSPRSDKDWNLSLQLSVNYWFGK